MKAFQKKLWLLETRIRNKTAAPTEISNNSFSSVSDALGSFTTQKIMDCRKPNFKTFVKLNFP